MSRNKPFILSAEVDGATIGFGLHRGVAWIQVSRPMVHMISTLSPYQSGDTVRSAAELVHPDLWPAYVSHFKPENNSDTLF